MKTIIKYYLFGLTICFCNFTLFAQNRNIDSLFILLKNDKTDTNKVNHLNTLCDEYIKIHVLDTALYYGNTALVLALTLNFKKGIANAYKLKGKAYLYQTNYNKALENWLPALKIEEELENKKGMEFLLCNIGFIVSGDFYFFHKNNQSVFIAVADCTGHGVPGAFMSMVGAGKLNDSVSQTTETSAILSLLNKGIKTALKQTDGEKSTRDGMDIALCSVDIENRLVKYAGANRPLWIIRKGQTDVEEIKATKTAIGGLTADTQHFDTHELKLQQGDTFYICTDGYADQFGGQTGKKLMTKKFKEILLEIQSKPMKEQEQYLDNFIEKWKAGTEQVDDILVIGIRL